MKDERLKLGTRLLIGGIAGFVGTMAMTSAMQRLHRRLPEEERYPLTPREIVDSVADAAEVDLPDETAKDLTTIGHFAYGAAMGALISVMNPTPSKKSGALAGTAVWLASYMGWIPALNVLEPATQHPKRRNFLMIGVHIVWGAATASAMRELVAARETILAAGPDKDVPGRGTPELPTRD
ncbi:hypothetical protein [Sphingomonas parva]|uniref:hypothetical protein n=1 Tax=Sphingomonas parva TaxID=2555898 RepID=UPI0017863F84|nr:hypothetical protein [Sphingomonas parva]